MTRKRYAGIQRAALITIGRNSGLPEKTVRALNKVVYKAEFRIPESLLSKGESYKSLYDTTLSHLHARMILGEV